MTKSNTFKLAPFIPKLASTGLQSTEASKMHSGVASSKAESVQNDTQFMTEYGVSQSYGLEQFKSPEKCIKPSASFLTQDLRDSNRKLGNLIAKFSTASNKEENLNQIIKESQLTQLESKQTNIFGFQKSNSFTSNLKGLKNQGSALKSLTVKRNPTKFRFVSNDVDQLKNYLFIPAGSSKDDKNALPNIDFVPTEITLQQAEDGKTTGRNRSYNTLHKKSRKNDRKKLDRYKSEVFKYRDISKETHEMEDKLKL